MDRAPLAERVAQTRASFDFQWSSLPAGHASIADPQFRDMLPDVVCRLTGLDRGWFRGKRVLDAGCGTGRYAYGLCTLGARVTAVDVSPYALRQTRDGCSKFEHFDGAVAADLRRPLPLKTSFDLVFSYGVLHHTGQTRAAFDHLADRVAPGGHLFVMVYGQPRAEHLADYKWFLWFEAWRQRCRHLSFAAKRDLLRPVAGDGRLLEYFDTISPWINERYEFDELREWFAARGFVDVHRCADEMDHSVIGRRAG
jgi:SAM-dependent methyltransferase